jgi:GNAT superfamily N-acetyltransferase
LPDSLIREVAPADLSTVVELVHDLAEYEKARTECHLTQEQLRQALFCEHPALFGLIAEESGVLAGFALWFRNFSTWRGTHGIYLEDLYVRPEYRGHGFGKQLLRGLARECVALGYSRLEWSVLDWNTPAIEFYRAAGAVPQSDWTVFRLSGEALNRFGA